MSTARFPDGHSEEVHAAKLREVFERAEEALERGAEKVTIYSEPHVFAGTLRRCETCGHFEDDDLHVEISIERVRDLLAEKDAGS